MCGAARSLVRKGRDRDLWWSFEGMRWYHLKVSMRRVSVLCCFLFAHFLRCPNHKIFLVSFFLFFNSTDNLMSSWRLKILTPFILSRADWNQGWLCPSAIRLLFSEAWKVPAKALPLNRNHSATVCLWIFVVETEIFVLYKNRRALFLGLSLC